MMKIQTKEADDVLVLQVEGRLSGAFVPELEDAWKTVHTQQPERKIVIDLKDVTCVDRAGRYLLQILHKNGVGFQRAGLAIQDMLEEITEAQECR
jgi:anti-anti-sigma regulatory factor